MAAGGAFVPLDPAWHESKEQLQAKYERLQVELAAPAVKPQ